jgi:hypothetical protein
MRTAVVVSFCIAATVLPRPGQAEEISPTVAAAGAVASRVALGQIQSGSLEGSWPEEGAYTGTIVAGLVQAYGLTCDDDLRVAAVAGGNFILRAAAGNYYGDEAYALTCLSAVSEYESSNVWRFAVGDFYRSVSQRSQAGAADYISQFEEADPSVALFFLAHHTVAAFYVDAEEKQLWREALRRFLVQVDNDTAETPVMALGMAVWALASTGPMEDALLDPNGEGSPYWAAMKVNELPELLLAQQVQEGEHAGSFYWRFDHANAGLGGPSEGYIEELVSGALGLAAIRDAADDPDPEIELAIVLVEDRLLESIDEDGNVRQHLVLGGDAYFYEAAGVLRALGCRDSDRSGWGLPSAAELSELVGPSR